MSGNERPLNSLIAKLIVKAGFVQDGVGAAGNTDAAPPAADTVDWGLLVAIVLVAVNLRPAIVSIGPVLPAIQREFGASHATASFLTAIPDLLMGLLALPTPWLARRFGRNPVLLVSLLLLCASTVVRAFASNTAGLLLATVGVGAGIAVAGALFGGLIKARFPDRVALLMGIYATGLSLGSTIAAALTGVAADHAGGGWRVGVGMWGVFGLLAIVGWRMVVRSDRNAGDELPTAGAIAVRFPFAWGRRG